MTIKHTEHCSPCCGIVFMNALQFRVIVEGHQIDSSPGCISELGDSLAGVSVDDTIWSNSQIQNCLHLILGGGGGGGDLSCQKPLS